MLKLVDRADTYEVDYKMEDTPEDKQPVFILKKLSAKEWNYISDRLTETEGAGKSSKLRFLSGTSTRLKIQKCLVDWRNVFDKDDKAVPCNEINKESLPAVVQSWIEDVIDKDNGLKGFKEEEVKN